MCERRHEDAGQVPLHAQDPTAVRSASMKKERQARPYQSNQESSWRVTSLRPSITRPTPR